MPPQHQPDAVRPTFLGLYFVPLPCGFQPVFTTEEVYRFKMLLPLVLKGQVPGRYEDVEVLGRQPTGTRMVLGICKKLLNDREHLHLRDPSLTYSRQTMTLAKEILSFSKHIVFEFTHPVVEERIDIAQEQTPVRAPSPNRLNQFVALGQEELPAPEF